MSLGAHFQNVPLLETKFHIPPVRPERVSRPRLIERLNAGLGQGSGLGRNHGFACKLTLVSAPAGFGKTTLVADWLRGAAHPFTWLSLDEGDNDPVRFLAYLIAALWEIDDTVGQAAQSTLGSPQLPAPDLAMTALINDLSGAPRPLVLVLDDYQHIRGDWIHQAVAFLIAHQPPQLHLVLITRTDPPLSLPRLRVRGQVTEIRAEDLRFTVPESAAFLDQALGGTLEAEAVVALEARTEGWIAGLQLASLALQARLPAQGKDRDGVAGFVAAFGGSHRHVIDYLADEVLAQQPDEIRHFLCQTAVLDRMTAPLCDAVTGREDSERLLRKLEQANLFLMPLDDRREWYRYHVLLADFLRTELDQETRAVLHAKAARWFAAQDLLPEAVGHALASGDVDDAAQAIALAAEEALRTASIATLSGWLDALPDEAVRANATLATYRGFVLYLTDRRDEAAAYADLAEQNAPADAPPSSRGRLACLKAHAALCNDVPGVAIQLARQALDGLGDADALFRDLALNVLGQALEQEGSLAAAADAYRDAFTLRRKAGNQLGTIVVLTNLAFALNELGRRREARELCQQVVKEGTAGAGNGVSVNDGAYLAWSLLSLEANELSLAREQAGRALALCRQAQISDGVWWAQYILARVYLVSGEIDPVRQVCRDVRRLDGRANQDLYGPWFAALEAQASLRTEVGRGTGGLAAAEKWAQAARLTPDDVPHRWNEYPYVVYVRLLLAQDRLQDAQKLLATMEQVARQSQRLRSLITVWLQQALVYQALGQEKQALARVEDALRLAATQDYRRAFLDEGPAIAELLPRARPVAPGFVDGLLQLYPGDGAATRDAGDRPRSLIEPLTEREQEILGLIAAGRSNPEIAELLYLSLNTVKWHARNLYGKLGAGNRVQAVARAQELDLL